jgi:hypothetical protein
VQYKSFAHLQLQKYDCRNKYTLPVKPQKSGEKNGEECGSTNYFLREETFLQPGDFCFELTGTPFVSFTKISGHHIYP